MTTASHTTQTGNVLSPDVWTNTNGRGVDMPIAGYSARLLPESFAILPIAAAPVAAAPVVEPLVVDPALRPLEAAGGGHGGGGAAGGGHAAPAAGGGHDSHAGGGHAAKTSGGGGSGFFSSRGLKIAAAVLLGVLGVYTLVRNFGPTDQLPVAVQTTTPAPVVGAQAPATPPPAYSPNGGQQAMPGNGQPAVTERWGSGKDLFVVAGTPPGYQFDGVSDPAKARLCVPPRRLVKTDQCRRVATGQIECKNACLD